MRVLVACECSGVVRDAFIARGHQAISCDIKPTEKPGPHYQGDVTRMLASGLNARDYDLLIAHPPCTYLSCASAPALRTNPARMAKVRDAVRFFIFLLALPIPFICVENPRIMRNVTGLPFPTQTIQPYYFGDPYMKATCLWLKGLPALVPTDPRPEARCYDVRTRRPMKPGSKSQRIMELPASWVRVPGNEFNPTARARTFQGVADAMADQWGQLRRPYGFY